MTLTAQQLAAVDHDGNLLLKACPGSGKTRVIIEKLVREIEAVRETPFAVACITYTNTAVEEIETRVVANFQTGDERHFVVSTIHAFCLTHVLRPFASRIPGFQGEMMVLTRDRPEFEEIANSAAADIGLFNLDFGDYEAFSNLNLDVNGALIGGALENEAVKRAAPFFWRRAEQLGFVDFANIIYKSYCLLRDDPEIARSVATRYRSFLIDEFQDTTEIQIEILKLIHAQGRARFFLVGDPSQSIFGFAGSRPELIDPFADHIGAEKNLTLSTNFRSNPPIVVHAERIAPRNPAMTSEGRTKNDTTEPRYFRVDNTFRAITDEFLPALAVLAIPHGRSAILARNWSQLVPIARGLREFGVPVVGPGARPYRRARLFAVLAEQLCGAILDGHTYNVRRLERAVFHAVQDASGEARLDIFSYEGRVTIIGLMREAARIAETGGAVSWLEVMSQRTGEILSQRGWIDNVEAGLFRASVEAMKGDMRNANVDLANLSIEDLGLFASPERALRLMTIHNAKGHEYAAVALIGLREGSLPDFRARDPNAVAGERRLFYVGLTRGERLLMYISERDRHGNPPSRFLGAGGVRVC